MVTIKKPGFSTCLFPLLAMISLLSILIAGWLYVNALVLPSPAAMPMALTTALVAGGLIATIGAAEFGSDAASFTSLLANASRYLTAT